MALAGSAPTQPLGHGLASRAWRQALRPRVFVSRGQLDQELASGADPASSTALAVRADQLLRRRYRHRLARSVEHLVTEFDANRGWWFSAAVPFLREQVAEARGTLVSVAGALRDTQPASARGVAMVSRLITNPESPLYIRAARGALQLRAHDALDHLLDGCQPWCELPGAPPLPTQEGPDGNR